MCRREVDHERDALDEPVNQCVERCNSVAGLVDAQQSESDMDPLVNEARMLEMEGTVRTTDDPEPTKARRLLENRNDVQPGLLAEVERRWGSPSVLDFSYKFSNDQHIGCQRKEQFSGLRVHVCRRAGCVEGLLVSRRSERCHDFAVATTPGRLRTWDGDGLVVGEVDTLAALMNGRLLSSGAALSQGFGFGGVD